MDASWHSPNSTGDLGEVPHADEVCRESGGRRRSYSGHSRRRLSTVGRASGHCCDERDQQKRTAAMTESCVCDARGLPGAHGIGLGVLALPCALGPSRHASLLERLASLVL